MVILNSFKGISYRYFNISDHSLSVYVIDVDPEVFKITPVHAFHHAFGRQSVKELADEHHAIAAINGGFFKLKPLNGLPAGILKINEQWYSWPSKPRGAIGWSEDGHLVLFDRLLCSGFVRVFDKTFQIQGLNRPRNKSETIIFTPSFNSTTLTPSDGFEVIIRQNQLMSIREGGNSFIPPDGYVISFGSKNSFTFWQSLSKHSIIEYHSQIHPQLDPSLSLVWGQLTNIVGGAPLLVFQGKVITDFSAEKTLDQFLNIRHSRTAVGILPHGHWIFVVVEGRQWSLNRGITIPDLAHLMASLGCTFALNLDGGGSSTMVFNGDVVNYAARDNPGELENARLVSDAILVQPKQ